MFDSCQSLLIEDFDFNPFSLILPIITRIGGWPFDVCKVWKIKWSYITPDATNWNRINARAQPNPNPNLNI